MAQLTDPAMLERVNGFLSENPNLLETDKYIVLHSLLGRNLYEERQLIPIRATEITTIAAKYGYDARSDKMEVAAMDEQLTFEFEQRPTNKRVSPSFAGRQAPLSLHAVLSRPAAGVLW